MKTFSNRLPSSAVCQRFGITRRTFGRWLSDPDLDFPQAITINGRHYFEEDKIEAWERQRAAASRKSTKRPPAAERQPANA